MMKKLFLACGILSSLLYFSLNFIAAERYEGYSSIDQTVSELSAIDAPTRPLWVSWMVLYTLLCIGFGIGILITAKKNKWLKITAGLMIFYAVFGFFWPPMHQREALAADHGSITDVLHIVWTFVTVPVMMFMIWFGGKAFGKQFRIYSVITLIALIAFGILTSIEAPNISKDLPTPFIGVWERINIGLFMFWVIVLSIKLMLNPTIDSIGKKGTISPSD